MPRVLVAFEGPVYRYDEEPAPGSRDALAALERRGYEVAILTDRDKTEVSRWLKQHGFPFYLITNRRLPAAATIDSHAIQHVDWTGSLSELARRYPTSSFGVVGSAQTPGSV